MKRIFFMLLLFTMSCNTARRMGELKVNNATVVTNGKLFATVYQQRAAEYRALCFQAFNIAHRRVDEIILTGTSKPKTIITDIDETILNNSPFEAHQTLQGKDY